MGNVVVQAPIQIKNNPTLPVLDQSRIAGGSGWVVADLTARDAIPTQARQVAMEVKVIDAGGAGTKYYSLNADLINWTEVYTSSYIPTSEKGAANGVATLDANGFVPASQIRNLFLNDSFIFASEAAMLAATTTTGNFAIRTDTGDVYIKLNDNGPPSVLGDWAALSTPGVATVNGQTGGVSIDFDALLAWGSSGTQFETALTNSAYITGLVGGISANASAIAANTAAIAALDTGGNMKGPWDASTAYEVDEYVESGGKLYRCISAHTNQQPPNATYWVVVSDNYTIGNGLTLTGTTLSLGGTLTSDTTINGNSNQHNFTFVDINNYNVSAAAILAASSSTMTLSGLAGLYAFSDTYAFIGNTGATVGFEVDSGNALGLLGAVLNYDIDRSGSYGNRSVPDWEAVKGQLGGQTLSALAISPGAGQNGYSLTWDNGAMEYTLTDVAGGGGGGSHTLLGTTHTDATTHVPVRGDLIIANSTPAWSALAIGTSGYFLKSNGNDPLWAQLLRADIADLSSLAGSGLTYDSGQLELGGTLGQNTTIVGSGYDYNIALQGAGAIDYQNWFDASADAHYVNITDGGDATAQVQIIKKNLYLSWSVKNDVGVSSRGWEMEVNALTDANPLWNMSITKEDGTRKYIYMDVLTSGITIQDTIDSAGFYYDDDYSAGATARWIPDKEYVDSVVAGWLKTGTTTLDNPALDLDNKFVNWKTGTDTVGIIGPNGTALGGYTRDTSSSIASQNNTLNGVRRVLAYAVRPNPTSGVPSAGYGVGFQGKAKSSTNLDQLLGGLDWKWVDATHASRTAELVATLVTSATERQVLALRKQSITLGDPTAVAANFTIGIGGSSGSANLILQAIGTTGKVALASQLGLDLGVATTDGSTRTITPVGSFANIGLTLTSKGSAVISFAVGGTQKAYFNSSGLFLGDSSAAGATQTIWAAGISGDASIRLAPKNSGAVILAILGSQKVGFYGTGGIVRATTGYAAASFVANTSGISDDTATWDGYTMGQVVKVLRDIGILT